MYAKRVYMYFFNAKFLRARVKSEEKRKERATLTMNAWFPGGATRAIIGKPLCGAAQHTDVWGVPRPDVDRVSDREQAFRHIQGGIQSRRNRILFFPFSLKKRNSSA